MVIPRADLLWDLLLFDGDDDWDFDCGNFFGERFWVPATDSLDRWLDSAGFKDLSKISSSLSEAAASSLSNAKRLQGILKQYFKPSTSYYVELIADDTIYYLIFFWWHSRIQSLVMILPRPWTWLYFGVFLNAHLFKQWNISSGPFLISVESENTIHFLTLLLQIYRVHATRD